MSSNIGITTLNFGSDPGSNEASITVTGQSTILATSKVETFVMGDDTTASGNFTITFPPATATTAVIRFS